MHETDAMIDARRYLEICNACRYCEGFCAVFPAMEQHREFPAATIDHLANLCHNCKGCFYSCQFAPPHEWGLNLPRVFAQVRDDSYATHAWPGVFARAYRRNGTAVAFLAAAAIALVLLLTLGLQDGARIFGAHQARPGAFYEVIPFGLMMWPALLTFAWALLAIGVTSWRFWQTSGAPTRALFDYPSWRQAIADAVTLRNLDGDGHGCNENDESYSRTRRHLHHAMAGGFMLCLAATMVATIYHHLLGWIAPYGLASLPVLLGTAGGVLMLAGTGGLFALKLRADPVPALPAQLGGDVAMLLLLAGIALTGLVLLGVRQTGAMGVALAVHLGCVLAFFLVLPYSKMMHAPFRLAALLRAAWDRRHA